MITKKKYICIKCGKEQEKETNHHGFFRCKNCKESISHSSLKNNILNKKLINITNKDLYESNLPDAVGSFLINYVTEKMNLKWDDVKNSMELKEVFIHYKNTINNYGYFVAQTEEGEILYNDFIDEREKDFKIFPLSIITNKQNITLKKQVSNDESDIFECNIRWDDECFNGGNSFAITGSYPFGNRFGCLHDDIEKFFPEFKHLIRFHGISTFGFKTYFSNINYVFEKYGLEKLKKDWYLESSENIKDEKLMKEHYKNILIELKNEIEKLNLIY